jgi:hypothetical protein
MATPPASSNPPKDDDPGSIDFELTDFLSARSALDELPEGVMEAKALRQGGWEGQRRKPVASDRALTGAALDWLMALPADLRPRRLCESFPRIVNLVATQWADPVRRMAVLNGLLVDSRGNRRGFPPEELREIQLLRHHAGN